MPSYSNQSTGYVKVNGTWYTVPITLDGAVPRFSLVVTGQTPQSVYVYSAAEENSDNILYYGQGFTWARYTGTDYFYPQGAAPASPVIPTTPVTPNNPVGTGTTATGLKKAVVTITVSNDRGERITITAKEGESLPSGITGINATVMVSPYINENGALVTNMRMYKVMLTPAADTYERRVYTATYVNKFGEEGPPSSPLEMDVSPYVQNGIVVPVPLGGVAQPGAAGFALNGWTESEQDYYTSSYIRDASTKVRFFSLGANQCFIVSGTYTPSVVDVYDAAGNGIGVYWRRRGTSLVYANPSNTHTGLYPGEASGGGGVAPANAYVDITGIRLYRTAVGATTDYLYVKEVKSSSAITGQTVIEDDVLPDALGHTLDTYDYYPPDQALQGIGVMANGIMYGFKGNEVHFSEPYLPYAWKPKAIKPLPRSIVGACPFEGGLYVITDAEPYIIQGTSPELMTDMRLPIQQGGLNKKAICNYNGAVVYGSNDGLVQLTGTQASLTAAQQFFTREKWRERLSNGTVFNGAQLRLNVHDGQLLCWFAGGSPGSFMIKLDETTPSLTKIGSPQDFISVAVNPTHDKLMFLERDYSGTRTTVSSFADSGIRRSALWRSKEFILPKPTHMAVLQVYGSGTVSCTVYADGDAVVSNQALDLSVMTRKQIRLPATRAQRWAVYFQTSNGEVVEAYLANSVLELRNV